MTNKQTRMAESPNDADCGSRRLKLATTFDLGRLQNGPSNDQGPEMMGRTLLIFDWVPMTSTKMDMTWARLPGDLSEEADNDHEDDGKADVVKPV